MARKRMTKVLMTALALSAAIQIVEGQVPKIINSSNVVKKNINSIKLAPAEVIEDALVSIVEQIVRQVDMDDFKCVPPQKGLLESHNAWLNRTNKVCERKRERAGKAAIDFAKSSSQAAALVQTTIAQTYLTEQLNMMQKQRNAIAMAQAKTQEALEQFKRNVEQKEIKHQAEIQRLKNQATLRAITRGAIKNIATTISSIPKATSEVGKIVTNTLQWMNYSTIIVVALILLGSLFLAYGYIDVLSVGMLSRGITRFAKTIRVVRGRPPSLKQAVTAQQTKLFKNAGTSPSPPRRRSSPSPPRRRSSSSSSRGSISGPRMSVMGSGNIRAVRKLSPMSRARLRAERFR